MLLEGSGAAQPRSLYEHYSLFSSDGNVVTGLATTYNTQSTNIQRGNPHLKRAQHNTKASDTGQKHHPRATQIDHGIKILRLNKTDREPDSRR